MPNGKQQGTFDIAFWLSKGDVASADANYLHLILDVIPHDLYSEKYPNADSEYLPGSAAPCK